MENSEIGKAIKAARTARGETQMILAARVGASQQIVSSWERGRRTVPPKYRKVLTKSYGVQFDAEIVKTPELSAPDRPRQLTAVEYRLIDQLRGVRDTMEELLVYGIRARRGRVLRRLRA